MKVFVLGSTGSIGAAVTRELLAAGHEVAGLCRSAETAQVVSGWGAEPVRGDLRRPDEWVAGAVRADGVIQAAATFDDEEAAIDARVVDALIQAAERRGEAARLRVIYTGGCWQYGETGDAVATESTAFDPLDCYEWAVASGERLLRSERLSTAIIHPAMVYHAEGGVFEDFLSSAKRGGPVEVWGRVDARWPLIHRDDLAVAYRLLLERPGLTGHFNASTEVGVCVSDIAGAFAARFAAAGPFTVRPVAELIAEHGEWAAGPALDQQMAAERLRAEAGWRPHWTDFRKTDVLA